jgi:hypothetical protein
VNADHERLRNLGGLLILQLKIMVQPQKKLDVLYSPSCSSDNSVLAMKSSHTKAVDSMDFASGAAATRAVKRGNGSIGHVECMKVMKNVWK